MPWLANGATGITHRAGLTGQEFTFSPSGRQISTLKQLTESGCTWGISSRYRGANRIGQAVWVMDGRKGTVFRVGLFTGAETADDAESDGFRLTDSGWLAGRSGDAVWVADAATGTTRRMGFGRFAGITESGWMAGTSATYSGGGSGDAAWVASAANGVARRIGLYEGPHYTSNLSGGRRNSFIRFMTESGWISGQSDLFDNSGSYSGTAAWVADAATGTTRRVGLFGDAEFSDNLHETSYVEHVTESGWLCGSSTRFLREAGLRGTAVWMADAATGTTRRTGLAGEGFTSANGFHYSGILGATESGWVGGNTCDYRDESGVAGFEARGYALWVADAATGAIRELGLKGEEFTGTGRIYNGGIKGITEEGWVFGFSRRFRGAAGAGEAAWVAAAADGTVKRLGLTGPDFTRAGDDYQDSTITGWTPSGFVRGTSTLYKATAQGTIPWVADVRTGQTFRPGLSGGIYTGSWGYEYSSIQFLTDEGLVGGQSNQFGNASGDGSTAWVFDIKTGQRTIFELSVSEGSTSGSSWIRGITPQGVVYGSYRFFKNSTYYEQRSFLWTRDLGTLLLDENHPPTGIGGTHGGQYLSEVTATGQGLIVGNSGRGVFYGPMESVAHPVPDLRVTDLTQLSASKYRLGFSTDAPYRITVQTSTDLRNWEDIQSLDAASGSGFLDLDASALRRQQYWRLKTLP